MHISQNRIQRSPTSRKPILSRVALSFIQNIADGSEVAYILGCQQISDWPRVLDVEGLASIENSQIPIVTSRDYDAMCNKTLFQV